MAKKEYPVKPYAVGFEDSCRNTANLPNRGGFRVRYICICCQEELCRWLGTKEQYCHHCGQKIDWRVIGYINSEQSDKIAGAGKEKESITAAYVQLVNELNETQDFKDTVFVAEPSK